LFDLGRLFSFGNFYARLGLRLPSGGVCQFAFMYLFGSLVSSAKSLLGPWRWLSQATRHIVAFATAFIAHKPLGDMPSP
jgi:hypothetical protein